MKYAVIRYTSPVEPLIEKGFSEDQMDTKRSDIIWNLTLKNKTTYFIKSIKILFWEGKYVNLKINIFK